jgi:hypothetical protein
MKNNTLTKINICFWKNINYYFCCFKKHDTIIHLNDFEKDFNEIYMDELEKDNLLDIRPIKMTNRY